MYTSRSLRVILFMFAFLAIFPQRSFAQTNLTSEREAQLQAELRQVELEQAQTAQVLAGAQQESASLKRDILILDTKIKAAQLNIKAKNLLIESLGKDISVKNKTIQKLSDRIEVGKESLAQLLRKTNEIDEVTLPEIVLSKNDLSALLVDIDNFDSVQKSLKDTFQMVRINRQETETEKEVLNKRKTAATDARIVIQQEEVSIKRNQSARQTLLKESQNQEKTYSTILAAKRKRAAEIRTALFALRDTAAIPFDKALEYAMQASRLTGIRPAFLLAILTQESSLGKNVGSCYLTDPNTGAGVSVKSGNVFPNVMKPGRDTTPFISISASLGIDPYKTLVSCPQSIGWGGAMGPAQFIPSTWMLFKSRIASAVGVSEPSPWDPKSAFMASAIYLTDLGAYSGSPSGEKNAACKYYSGKSCSGIGATYGAQVMAKADTIQKTMIDPLQGL